MTSDFLDTKIPHAPFSAYNDNKITELIKTNLSNESSGDEFYKKLVELKNEQKKTLEYMKELYNQKQILKNEIEKSEVNLNELKSSVNKPLDGKLLKFERNVISAYDTNIHQINNINIVNKTVDNELLNNHNHNHNHNDHVKFNELQQSIENNQQKLNEKNIVNDVDENLKKIEEMWDKFNLDAYNESNKNYPELKVFEEKSSNTKILNDDDWAYKVTVPKPFNFLIRDQQKTGKKSKRQIQLEEELRKKEEAEIKECNKQFKARPVPTHVFKPLYEEKKQEEEIRKLRLKLESKEYLESVVKPFNITERRHSFSGQTEHEENIVDKFTANPLPEFYFDNDYLSERRKEEELYKKIKSQIRSHKMLKNSKLPRNMILHKEKKRLEIERENFSTAELNKLKSKENLKIRKSYEIPNYDDLYKKFTSELEAKRHVGQSKTTVCKPFQLQTNKRAKKKEIFSASSTRISSANSNRMSLISNDSMTRLQRSQSATRDSMPIQHTESQKLRESVTKSKIDTIALNEARKEHIDKMKKIKAQNMAKQMEKKLTNPSPKDLSQTIDRKTRKMKLEEQKKIEDYERQLELMNKKVESKKFLFEMADEENAKKAAEKKFRETLKKAGLSEDILNENNNSNKKTKNKIIAQRVSKSYIDEWVNE